MAQKHTPKPTPKAVVTEPKATASAVVTSNTGFKMPGIQELKTDAKYHFIGAAFVIFLFLMVLARNTGINADERYHVPYTKYFADYFTSGGKDTMYRQIPLDEFWKARVMFDMVNYGIAHGILGYESGTPPKLGDQIMKKWEFADYQYHEIRHILLAIVAFIGILFSGLIAVRIRGWHFGILVMFLMCISPTFIGHAAMNPRDIPFFAWSTLAIYYMFVYVDEFPKVKWKTVFGIIAGVSLALNVRNGGFLTFAYFGLFGFCTWVYHLFFLKDRTVDSKKLVIQGAVAFGVSYILGLLFWPYGQTDPVHIPIFVDLLSSQKYPITLRQLFEGKLVNSGDLPWYYQTKLLIITAPLVVLAGFGTFCVLALKNFRSMNWKLWLLVFFCAFFPILYIIKVDANVHTGWRHVIFCYPFLMIMTAMGWTYMRDLLKSPIHRWGVVIVFTAMSFEPIYYMANNFQHAYIYFNYLVGGDEGAWGDYEFDYWSVSLTEGGKWLKREIVDKAPDNQTIIITSNMWDSFGPYFKKDMQKGKVKFSGTKIYNRCGENWDYALYYAAFLDPELLKNPNFWPLPGTIHTITANGAPIGIVVKRDPEKLDYKGFQASEAKDFNAAVDFFSRYLQKDPYNDEVYKGRAMAYLNLNQIDAGIKDFQSALSLNPKDISTLEQMGNIYLSLRRFNDALAIYNQELALDDTRWHIQAYQNIGKVYEAQGDAANANFYYQKAQEEYNKYNAEAGQ